MINKRQRKTQRQSRMDNPETSAALGTQDTGRRHKTTTQKTGANTGARKG